MQSTLCTVQYMFFVQSILVRGGTTIPRLFQSLTCNLPSTYIILASRELSSIRSARTMDAEQSSESKNSWKRADSPESRCHSSPSSTAPDSSPLFTSDSSNSISSSRNPDNIRQSPDFTTSANPFSSSLCHGESAAKQSESIHQRFRALLRTSAGTGRAQCLSHRRGHVYVQEHNNPARVPVSVDEDRHVLRHSDAGINDSPTLFRLSGTDWGKPGHSNLLRSPFSAAAAAWNRGVDDDEDNEGKAFWSPPRSSHSIAPCVSDPSSSPWKQGYYMRLAEQDGCPCYIFAVDSAQEVLICRMSRREKKSDNWVYAFHSKKAAAADAKAGWRRKEMSGSNLLLGKMRVYENVGRPSPSHSLLDGHLADSWTSETHFVLYRKKKQPRSSRKHQNSKDFVRPPPRMRRVELAAIVIRTSVAQREHCSTAGDGGDDSRAGWGFKFLAKPSGRGWGMRFLDRASRENHDGIPPNGTTDGIRCNRRDETLDKCECEICRGDRIPKDCICKIGRRDENLQEFKCNICHRDEIVDDWKCKICHRSQPPCERSHFRRPRQEDSSAGSRPRSRDQKRSAEVAVILPAEDHGLPREDGDVEGEREEVRGPTPLVERWRSGGSCECGGWDMGCGITVLNSKAINLPNTEHRRLAPVANQDLVDWPAPGTTPLHISMQGVKQSTVLTMESIGAGHFFVSFQGPFSSPLQAFATAVAILHQQVS